MISVSLDQLYGWINAFIFPFCRIGALMAFAPIFGEATLPARVKTYIALALTMTLAPSLGAMPAVAPGSWTSLLIMAQQIVIGMAMGLAMRVIFAAVQVAGDLVGLQMGLSFATLLDPATGANTTVLSRLFNIVALLLFLAMDGHLLMLAGFWHAFEVLPIAATPLHAAGIGVLLEWGAQLMVSGLLMALPLITALLSINLAMAILNRTAPQMSVFAVGFPLSLIVGLIALMIVLPRSDAFLSSLFEQGLQTMMRIAQELAS
jgi:flagellar biosynthetic protein FliR